MLACVIVLRRVIQRCADCLRNGTGQGHMAPCVVKDMVEGSASHACGSISPGDLLIAVDGVQVPTTFA
jgi:hypothetical protein